MSSSLPNEHAPAGSTPLESSATQPSRGKTDPAWAHCLEGPAISAKGRSLVCTFCEKVIKGGGINRIKQHLAGIRGEVEPCRKCSDEVRNQMKSHLEGNSQKFQKKRKMPEDVVVVGHGLRDFEEQEYMRVDNDVEEIRPSYNSTGGSCLQKGNQGSQLTRTGFGNKRPNIGAFFVPRTTPGSQPTLKSVLQTKEKKEQCDLAISKWMIDASIPFNAVNSEFYQPALDLVANYGGGYKGPNFHDLRGYLLNKNVAEVRNFIESFRETWKETGCTIMADGWTDQSNRTLINFLVYCPRGTVFLKSVDASNASKTAEMLYKLFREVGAENVVQMITDNAANYVAAGRLLEKEFSTLYWSPCSAHCLNLMFKDIGLLVEVSDIVLQASRITKYIYNHCYALYLMRKHTGGREILRPATTRFATNYIALQSILAQKDALRAMVTSRDWTISAYAKERKAKQFVDNVLDSMFWRECEIIVQITEPLVRMLRIVDSDERPSMGYLYAGMMKTREELVKRFQRRKRRLEPYLEIIDSRWDFQLRKNLHAAGYWLNPSKQYDTSEKETVQQTVSGLLDVIERYSYGNASLRSNLTKEMKIFKNAIGDFGRVSAICDRNEMLPDEWWSCYGNGAPNLQRLAIRVLSQTCSSSGCERNWSVFEHIHTKKRNRLEHQRLNDLVYVRYNLRLLKRQRKGRNYDPIDFEEFDNDIWILEDDPPILTNDEIESYRQDLDTGNFQININDDERLNLDHLDDIGDDELQEEHGTDQHATSSENHFFDDGVENIDDGSAQWLFNHA